MLSSENLKIETCDKGDVDLESKQPDNPTNQLDIEPTTEKRANEDNLKNSSTVLKEPIISPPITVPYLSPLVLRKELESMLEREGDTCLVDPSIGIICLYLFGPGIQ